ncbi:MerR family transcriptional regulator [Humisphaera borealis]|uniref:Uncharacterized protein n=1 Tax=Humisphaera borealis TaxID=2807512 RepID=A0A7M2WPM1_9BACT|nr:helix-turn-helix domain-containing protein [Humisphaera borealis]QOV87418.1 hypothetical protein IPV69_14070 [Humisphaera borealis]
MMAKMFYTMEEAKSALGKSEDEIRQFAREGRLREFRDGPRLMFKADQVEQLRAEVGGGIGAGMDQVDLGVSDSGGLIGLVDTTGASGTSITLSDSEGSSGSLKMKDDTALAADLGLSGSLGGMPSPGPVRAGAGGPSGTGLSGSMSGRSGAGINVFGGDDVEHVDPMAQTAITGAFTDQIDLQAVGSGSGLLDLTRESDDTSLGAVLDEITPQAAPPMRRGAGYGPLDQGEGSLGAAFEDVPATPRAPAAPVYIEKPDALAPAFGGAALAASLVCIFGLFVLISAMLGTRPDAVLWFETKKINMWMGAGIGFGGVLFFFIFGLILGRLGKR